MVNLYYFSECLLAPAESESKPGKYLRIKHTYKKTNGLSQEYYIKGYGLYKSTELVWGGGTVVSMEGLWAGASIVEPISTQIPEVFSSMTTVSVKGEIHPTSFSPITVGANTSTLYLDSWTWNGAYPWVYNANTDSWFYYRFNGNACFAYDVRSSKWFAFDGQSKAWVDAN
jgi:hypothetical protein